MRVRTNYVVIARSDDTGHERIAQEFSVYENAVVYAAQCNKNAMGCGAAVTYRVTPIADGRPSVR